MDDVKDYFFALHLDNQRSIGSGLHLINLEAITTRIKNHLPNYHQRKENKSTASEKKM